MSLLRTIAAAALAAAPAVSGGSQPPPSRRRRPGTLLAETLALYGKAVPLPPGPWRVARLGFGQIRDNAPPDAYGAIASVLLDRPSEASGDDTLLVQTNVLPVRGGWGPPPECEDPARCSATCATRRTCTNPAPSCWHWQTRSTAGGAAGPDAGHPALARPARRASRQRPARHAGIRYAVRRTGWSGQAALRRLADWTEPAAGRALAALRAPAGQPTADTGASLRTDAVQNPFAPAGTSENADRVPFGRL